MKKPLNERFIKLTGAELQSGSDRVNWAEGLILQLPKEHDGRNSWLLNYGTSEEAVALREKRGLPFNEEARSAPIVSRK